MYHSHVLIFVYIPQLRFEPSYLLTPSLLLDCSQPCPILGALDGVTSGLPAFNIMLLNCRNLSYV